MFPTQLELNGDEHTSENITFPMNLCWSWRVIFDMFPNQLKLYGDRHKSENSTLPNNLLLSWSLSFDMFPKLLDLNGVLAVLASTLVMAAGNGHARAHRNLW